MPARFRVAEVHCGRRAAARPLAVPGRPVRVSDWTAPVRRWAPKAKGTTADLGRDGEPRGGEPGAKGAVMALGQGSAGSAWPEGAAAVLRPNRAVGPGPGRGTRRVAGVTADGRQRWGPGQGVAPGAWQA